MHLVLRSWILHPDYEKEQLVFILSLEYIVGSERKTHIASIFTFLVTVLSLQ